MRYGGRTCARFLSSSIHHVDQRTPYRLPLPRIASYSETARSSHDDERWQIHQKRLAGDKNTTAKPIRTQSWRTLLANKSLGNDASVLILRDSETKKARTRTAKEEDSDDPTTDSAAGDVDEILSAMREQLQDQPSKFDVFKSISALKPESLSGSEWNATSSIERPLITHEAFRHCVDRLSEAFTRSQMLSFVQQAAKSNQEVKKRASIGPLGELGPRELQILNNVENLKHVQCVKWSPEQRLEEPLPTKSSKADAAAKIIFVAWGFDITEQAMAKGSLAIAIDPTLMRLLLANGKNSVLSNTCKRRRVRCDYDEHQITLSGTKSECFGSAIELDHFLLQHHAIPLQRNSAPISSLSEDIVQTIASSCQCFVQKTGDSVRICGWNVESTQLCVRLLMSQAMPTLKHHTTLFLDGDPTRSGYIIPNNLQADALPYRLRLQDLGRFSLPHAFAKGRSTIQSLPATGKRLQAKTFESIKNCLLQEADSELPEGTRTSYVAYFGHSLHPLKHDATLGRTTGAEIMKSASEEFVSTAVVGAQSLRTAIVKPKDRGLEFFRIRLTPSPLESTGVNTSSDLPTIELSLGLDPQFSPPLMRFWSARAILEQQEVIVMTPSTDMDMCFVRRQVVELNNLTTQQSIQKHIVDTISPATGLNEGNAPLFVKFRLPGAIPSPAAAESGKKVRSEVEFDYTVAAVNREESVKVPLGDYDLQYYRTQGSVVEGNSEGMSLCTSFHRTREGVDKEERAGRFLTVADDLLEAVASGTISGVIQSAEHQARMEDGQETSNLSSPDQTSKLS